MASTSEPDSPRQLVVCCDGTNNTLTGGTKDTNVLRLVTHLACHPSPERRVHYDPGVGSPVAAPPTDPLDWARRSWERISGLASGRGVYDNMGQAYLFLMRNWRDDRDRIYCFGFSRGAFTARGVAGMVNLFGILKPEHEVLIPTLIRVYFSQPEGTGGALRGATRRLQHVLKGRGKVVDDSATRERLAEQIRELFTTPAGRHAWVHWVGVWDTVESVGLPGPLSRSNPSTATLRRKRLRNVRHALSFDEHRWTFEPRLYEEPGDIHDGGTGQTLKQRWFAGVHCDVGGSYPVEECRLSSEALEWMVAEVASDLGVPPLPAGAAARIRHDALWETPWWALAGMCLRNMQPRSTQGEPISVFAGAPASEPSTSVWEARRGVWPLVFSLFSGLVCLLLSGACLLPDGWQGLWTVDGLRAAATAAQSFASDQLASLCGRGLRAEGHAPWQLATQPAWAMFWDFGFTASWAYLLARIGSRAFAWLAGTRNPTSPLPWWRALGMAPLAAVGGDVSENLLTLAALAMHAAGTDALGNFGLWLAGAASLCKFAGLAACLPLLAVRCWIAMPGVPPSRA